MRWCIRPVHYGAFCCGFRHHHRSDVIECNSEEFSHCSRARKKQFGTLLEHSNHFTHNYSVYMQRISAMFTIKSFQEARQRAREGKVIAIRCTWCWSICCDHLSLFARRCKRLQWRKNSSHNFRVKFDGHGMCMCSAPVGWGSQGHH